jgi:uncharacterized membrane protein YoaK (UPF0700 family)
MPESKPIADGGASGQDARHGPLPPLLLVLTVVTGLVDAVSYLKLGHVFVANMTGNVVFLGFAAAGAADLSAVASLLAIGSFLAGALAGGRLGSTAGQHRGRFLALTTYAQIGLIGAALAVSLTAFDAGSDRPAYALVVLLASAMGLQNATARRLSVPDLTTTVLTLTLTGLSADSKLAGGTNPNFSRRLLASGAMLLGALIGAFLVLHAGISAALALTLALLVLNGIAGYRVSSSTAAWTAAK